MSASAPERRASAVGASIEVAPQAWTLRDRVLLAAGAVALALVVAWSYARDLPLRAGVAHQHLASVRELSRGEFPPRHNLIAGHAPQGHYGPYFVALGALARATGAAPQTVLYAAGVAGALAFVLVFARVALELAGPAAAAWSPWCAALLWGPWPSREMSWSAWGWPGTTSPADAQNFFYPQHAGLVLLLAVVALLLPRDASAPRRREWIAALLLSALLVATHPLTAIALAIATASLAAAGMWERRFGAAAVAGLVLLPFAGLALAASWPYYPVLGLLRAFGDPGIRQATAALATAGAADAAAVAGGAVTPSPGPTPLLSVLGPAAAGLAGVILLARQRRPFLLIWTVAGLVAVFCPLLPLRQRLVTFLALPLHLGMAALAARVRTRWMPAALAVLLVAGAASAALRMRWVLAQERIDLAFLPALVPENGVVLSDPRTSNAIAGLTGRKIVAPEGPDVFLVLAGGYQRNLDADRFLGVPISDAERRTILARWGVTHVLVDRLGATRVALPYPVTYEGGGFVLYDVR